MGNSDRLQVGSLFALGHLRVNHIRVLVRFGLSEVRVRVTYRYHASVRMGSVRVEFGLGLFRVLYNSPGSDRVWVKCNLGKEIFSSIFWTILVKVLIESGIDNVGLI